MQVVENKYGKHCHLCAYFTKDPIVRSYFRFYKIFDISVAALRSIITPLYRYRIHKLMRVFLTEMVGSTTEKWMINLYCVKREEEQFSISFLWSVNYDWWSVVCGRERSSQPLPAATGRVVSELSCWRGSALLFLIGCECDGNKPLGFLCCRVFAVQFHESLPWWVWKQFKLLFSGYQEKGTCFTLILVK